MRARIVVIVLSVSIMGWVSVSLVGGREVSVSRTSERGNPINVVERLASVTDAGLPRDAEFAPAAGDTTELGFWDFEGAGVGDPQGWVSVDRTLQTGDYWHVDDFAGLGGGDFGRLVPLEGMQSLWCGVRPNLSDPIFCSYATLPGYANDWDQAFCTANCLTVTGDVQVDFLVMWDTEDGYDFAYVEWDSCDSQWTTLGEYTGVGSDYMSLTLPSSAHAGEVRLRLRVATDPSWSDQDGLWNTDGAVIVDSLTVRDESGVVLPTELFEAEAVGDHQTASGNWASCIPAGYGDFAGLFHGSTVVQEEDPCLRDVSWLWGFFNGSTYDYSCGGYPSQKAVPYGNDRGQYIRNEIWSPEIALTGSGTVFNLQADIYFDLQQGSLVYETWAVRSIVNGCAERWRNDNFFIPERYPGWVTKTLRLDPYISGEAFVIQVALGVEDFCPFWGGTLGDCGCHSHAPIFDNVRVYRVDLNRPQWWVRDIDLFQDNFSEDGTITGTARADMAADILPSRNPGVLPGDSAVVTVSGSTYGLGLDPTYGGAAVYGWFDVQGPNGALTGSALVDDPRYHVVGTQEISGRTWTQIQFDSTWTAGGALVTNRYNIDLHDDLFVPGDTVWFFFGAKNTLDTWTYFSLAAPTPTGETEDVVEAAENPDEFTILPAGGYNRGGDFLYVDGMNFMGAESFFELPLRVLYSACGGPSPFTGYYYLTDRYDIRAPSSAAGNHPGARVKNVLNQLVPVYRKILWNTGDLGEAFGDGSGNPDKSDDTGLLYTFLDQLPATGGVYLSGDDVASVWASWWSPSANALRIYMPYTLVSFNHRPTVGISPYVVGTPGGMFSDVRGPDTLVAYGGCPVINDFDVIAPNGTGVIQAATYEGNGASAGAIVADTTTNAQGALVGFILSGFSFHEIRDAFPEGWPARVWHMERILGWLGECVFDAMGSPLPGVNSLFQNYPNPFNPATTIRYSIAERGHVSLRIYDVTGRLVRTLVDGEVSPEAVRPVTWNGLNDSGQPVSSGVYFGRLETKGFTQTKKLVLLK